MHHTTMIDTDPHTKRTFVVFVSLTIYFAAYPS